MLLRRNTRRVYVLALTHCQDPTNVLKYGVRVSDDFRSSKQLFLDGTSMVLLCLHFRVYRLQSICECAFLRNF